MLNPSADSIRETLALMRLRCPNLGLKFSAAMDIVDSDLPTDQKQKFLIGMNIEKAIKDAEAVFAEWDMKD